MRVGEEEMVAVAEWNCLAVISGVCCWTGGDEFPRGGQGEPQIVGRAAGCDGITVFTCWRGVGRAADEAETVATVDMFSWRKEVEMVRRSGKWEPAIQILTCGWVDLQLLCQ